MRCESFHQNLHEFLDLQLDAQALSRAENHLEACPKCQDLVGEFRLVQSIVARRVVLPDGITARMSVELKRNRRRSWRDRFLDLWDRIRTSVRDMEPISVWTKATAMPVTCLIFFLLLQHFAPVQIESLAFLIVSAERQTSEISSPPLMFSIQVEQNRSELNGIINAARKLPYEDSLTLVAEIDPDGRAEIGDVLEYPKSYDLLNAVQVALSTSQFKRTSEVASPVVIFSLQKIDVYEDSL
ncbi:MAG: zf-HC2 domain-containing protein [Acidobacteriota bacterium]|nr:MAG: zf-HC2 domain-containing protein [Acidobacteriota bacterium]